MENLFTSDILSFFASRTIAENGQVMTFNGPKSNVFQLRLNYTRTSSFYKCGSQKFSLNLVFIEHTKLPNTLFLHQFTMVSLDDDNDQEILREALVSSQLRVEKEASDSSKEVLYNDGATPLFTSPYTSSLLPH